MRRRRESSKIFGIGAARSPYVLDLNDIRQEIPAEIPLVKLRRSPKARSESRSRSAPGTKKPRRREKILKFFPSQVSKKYTPKQEKFQISKEDILRELSIIESYDAELASTLSLVSEESEHDALFADYAISKHEPPTSSLESHVYPPDRRAQLEDFLISKDYRVGPEAKSHNMRGFIFLSALFTLLISGAFFAQKANIFSASGIFWQNTRSLTSPSFEADESSQTQEGAGSTSKNYLSLAASIGLDLSFGGWSFWGNLDSLFGVVDIVKDFYSVAPTLFAENGSKKYMVIFQNSSELRPTGGFIGSYAIVDVQDGEITNVSVDGIYNLDGQLTVNVVPPEPFFHITSAWSTHDANWFLDFPTSAEKIMWFYERAAGESLDGVISVNVEVIEKLLNVTGPIALPEYDLVLDSENFRDEIQYEVEVAYDTKLNRPKKVLADLFPVLMERLSSALKYSESQKNLVAIALESFAGRDIMLYSKDENVEEFFEEHGWSGSVVQQDGDYLAVVHSNIGGYKTDKYTDNIIDYNIEIKENGEVIGHLRVARKHNGGDSKYWWYNRKNIDYLKVYVPLGSQIISYSGGERREFKNKPDYDSSDFVRDAQVFSYENEATTFGPVDIFHETGKTVFGTWLVTNPKSTSQLTLTYKLPFRIGLDNEFIKYNLYMQKQAGTVTQSTFDISFPDSWETVWSKAKNEFSLDKDEVIGYIFKK